jgi:hypothetical protein
LAVGEAAAGAAAAPLPRRVWINFLLVAVLWLGAALWAWWFTDLELRLLVGSVGGIGLLLVPLWLLDKLPKLAAGVEAALRRVLGRLLASRVTLAVLLVLLAAGAVAGSSAGTLQLDSDLGEPALWTGPGGAAEVTVEVAGFSPVTVTVRPWRRPSLQVPADLRRAAVLFHPSEFLADLAASAGLELTVALPGEAEPRRMAFDGRPVWVGCSAGCTVPAALSRRWQQKLADRPSLLGRLERPRSLPGELTRLAAGDRLEVAVLVNSRPFVPPRTIIVTGAADQTEELDVP